MTGVRKLQNPRGYISWTQKDMWDKSPDRYIEQYMYGEKSFTNSGMEFGSRVGHALETGEQDEDETVNMLASMLPRYSIMEHPIEVNLRTPIGWVTLMGKLDTFEEEILAFDEYKTGVTPWTASKVRKHGQMGFYSALVYLKYGKIPSKARLHWAQTEKDWDGQIHLTGGIQTFEATKTMREVLMYLADISRVAVEIDRRYRDEIKKIM